MRNRSAGATVGWILLNQKVNSMLFNYRCLLLLAFGFGLAPPAAQAREWGDAEGRLAVEAELFAFNEDYVVLARADNEMALLAARELSAEDREYLKSKAAAATNEKNLLGLQTWATTNISNSSAESWTSRKAS